MNKKELYEKNLKGLQTFTQLSLEERLRILASIGIITKGKAMNNEEVETLKNKVKELEKQINTLKQLILNSTYSSGHFSLSTTDEKFLYTKVGDE